jgi:hypothetical protein
MEVRAALLLSVLFFLDLAQAAPIPMSSSSRAISPFWGLFLSDKGFSVDGRASRWEIADPPADSLNVLALFKSPTKGTARPATMSVRVDDNTQRLQPQKYIKGWLLLYHRLGLDVKGHQPFLQNGETGYVLDVVDRGLSVQSRQALFFRGSQVVILTCTDAKAQFVDSLATCNQIIRTFKWSEKSDLSIQK